MHHSAMKNGEYFFNTYTLKQPAGTVIDIGSLDVNGSLRSLSPSQHTYIGVDFVAGNGVDVVLTDDYKYPFESNYADFVVSSSCLEHADFFWITFLEMLRILKPGGLLYINAPSNGAFHRYPVDNWRFYPDSGKTLAKWANASGYPVTLLESYISGQTRNEGWNDMVMVFIKDTQFIKAYPDRISSQPSELSSNPSLHE